MPIFFSLQIPPPANWQDFESLCCDLWREIWKDPNTQKNGRQGQPQHGVDISGSPNQESLWAGVQCKGKDNYTDKSLTEGEVKTEVEKAKAFEPKLSQFIIATTGPKDAKIEEVARIITGEHLGNGLFSVHIWGWDDIVARLAEFPELIEKHYPQFGFRTKGIEKDVDEIKAITQEILKNTGEIKAKEATMVIKDNIFIFSADTSTTALTIEYQAELDHSRDLINTYKLKEALEFLEKLKDRIWSNAAPTVKYRLLTNIGSAKLAMNQEKEAAKLFLEALKYNPEDEKSLCNTAFGYLLLGQVEPAVAYAYKALDKNPASSRAYSILIEASSEDNLEEIITKVPERCRTSPEVAYAIGAFARQKENLIEAEKWFQIADENGKESLHELKGALGGIILQRVTEGDSVVYGNQLDDSTKEKINKAVQLLTNAWEFISDTDLRNFRLTWIVNRSIAKGLLGDLQGAIKDIEIALEIDPSNPISIKHRAILAYESNDNLKAIDFLKTILTSRETPEASLLLAEALRKEGKFPEAKSFIEEFLKMDVPNPLKEEANRILMNLYIDSKDFVNAKKISDSLRTSNPTNILNLVYAGRISRFLGESDDALSLLQEAEKYIISSSTFREILAVATEFYSLEQFEDAARIYERIVNKSLDAPLTRELLNSYYRSGELGKALEICQALRKKYGPLKYVSEMESAIYEEIGNLPEARKVCQEYLNVFPDDFGAKLRLALVNLHSNNLGELDEFLSSSIDIDSLSFESSFLLANLSAIRKLYEKSFEIMYERRRKFFNYDNAHSQYIGFFLQRDKELDSLLNVTKVCIDSAVCIEDDSGQKEWYIIEDRKDADIARREISTKHHLAQKLLGKSINEILLENSDLSTEFGKVIEVKSKYVYAFQESLGLFPKFFPDTPGLQRIKMGPPEKEGDLPKGFQQILDHVSRSNEITTNVEQLYKEGKITIGLFAKLINRNVLGVWGNLIRKPDVGIRCTQGNIEERNFAFALLNAKPKLVLDIISLITLHGINAADFIIRAFGKLAIAQSTIDLFQEIINEKKFFAGGFMTIGKEGDQYVKEKISAEEVKGIIDYLDNIMNWVEINCDVLPYKAALGMKRAQKQQLGETFGRSFILMMNDYALLQRENSMSMGYGLRLY